MMIGAPVVRDLDSVLPPMYLRPFRVPVYFGGSLSMDQAPPV